MKHAVCDEEVLEHVVEQVARQEAEEVADQLVGQVEQVEQEGVLELEQVVESQLCGHLHHHPPPD